MQIDTIKAVFAYGTTSIVVLGGLAALVWFQMPPDKLAIVAGLVGAALQFITGQETATRTARQIIASSQTNGTQRETLKGA